MGTHKAADRFQKYQATPEVYAREALGVAWWAKQIEIAHSVRDHRQTAVYSGHATGKTNGAAGIAQWHFDCYSPSITLTTAPTWNSVHDLLWGEIKNQRKAQAPGRLMDMRIDGGPMHYIKGHNAESGAAFQGRHEARMLIILDESQGIPPYIWEAANAMMTSTECRMLVLGNPTEAGGKYYDIREDPAWNVITISCLDHPNIAAELAGMPPPYPKAISLTWVKEMMGEHTELVSEPDADCFEFPTGSGTFYRPDDVFRARVLGVFPKQASSAVWSDAWLSYSREHELELMTAEKPEMGVDVARFGDDQTVIYSRHGGSVVGRLALQGNDTMEVAGKVAHQCDSLTAEYGLEPKTISIKVDDSGVGGGVTDRLRELGYRVFPIVAGSRARDPRSFYNMRTELWFVSAYMARDRKVDLSRLPQDVYRKLSAELKAARYRMQSDKTLRVEDKAEYKKRLGRSPDDADAFNLCFYPVEGAPAGAVAKVNPVVASRWGESVTGSRWKVGRRKT